MWTAAELLLLACLLPGSSQSACTDAAGCNGCGTTVISCAVAGLAQFPNISVDHAMLVEDLGLKFNHLSSISVSDLQHFTALIELDLSENNITHIEEGSFANSPELVTISLADNPLHCDCGLRWLLDYLDSLPLSPDSELDAGTCATPSNLSATSIMTLTHSDLICECVTECGTNEFCDLSLGTCECDSGYTGENCSEVCSQGTYGRSCSGVCACEAGTCHHVTGQCTCFPDYHGENCSHNCNGAPDCALLGREACSLSTPEHTCGVCHSQPAGDDVQWSNSSCVYTTSVYTTSASMYTTSCVAGDDVQWSNSSCVYTTSVYTTSASMYTTSASMYTTSASVYTASVELQPTSVSTTPSEVTVYTSASIPPSDDSPLINLSSKEQLIIVTVLSALVLVVSLLAIASFAVYCWKYAKQRGGKIAPSGAAEGKSQDVIPCITPAVNNNYSV